MVKEVEHPEVCWRMVDWGVCVLHKARRNEVRMEQFRDVSARKRIPKKTRRPVPSSGKIITCENPGVTRQGIETASPWREASILTAQPPRLRELWLGCSPPTTLIRVRYPAGSLPDFRMWESCWTTPLAGGFSRDTSVFPALAFQRRSILESRFMSCPGMTDTYGSQLESTSLGECCLALCSLPTRAGEPFKTLAQRRGNLASVCGVGRSALIDGKHFSPYSRLQPAVRPVSDMPGDRTGFVDTLGCTAGVCRLFTVAAKALPFLLPPAASRAKGRRRRSRNQSGGGRACRGGDMCNFLKTAEPPGPRLADVPGSIPAFTWRDFGKPWKTEIMMTGLGIKPGSSRLRGQWFTTSRARSVLLFTSHQGGLDSIPGGVAPGFSHLGIVADDVAGGRFFSGFSRYPRPCIPVLLRAHLVSLSSALNTSRLRAAQTSPVSTSLFHLPVMYLSGRREGVESQHCDDARAGRGGGVEVAHSLRPRENGAVLCRQRHPPPYFEPGGGGADALWQPGGGGGGCSVGEGGEVADKCADENCEQNSRKLNSWTALPAAIDKGPVPEGGGGGFCRVAASAGDGPCILAWNRLGCWWADWPRLWSWGSPVGKDLSLAAGTWRGGLKFWKDACACAAGTAQSVAVDISDDPAEYKLLKKYLASIGKRATGYTETNVFNKASDCARTCLSPLWPLPRSSTLASHQGEPGLIPGRVTGFSEVGIAVDRRIFSVGGGDLPFPPPLHYGAAPYSLQSHSSLTHYIKAEATGGRQLGRNWLERSGLVSQNSQSGTESRKRQKMKPCRIQLLQAITDDDKRLRGQLRNYMQHHMVDDDFSHRLVLSPHT
ncbi:hypothetical protein PR048_006369 [Dryococelus australis]|uniref:Uncharacterized protein n=1 Tax=Dryococelus australis TaxID=614101 RepID=A0ABQ9IC12_9NEOP|nr:hypothetical protein PR048_006369 [Dryococelus australis]